MPEAIPTHLPGPRRALSGARAVLKLHGEPIVGMDMRPEMYELTYLPAEVLPDGYCIKRIEQDLKDPGTFIVYGEYTPPYAAYNVGDFLRIPSNFGRLDDFENDPFVPAAVTPAAEDKNETVKRLVDRPMGGFPPGTPCYLCGDQRRPVVRVRSCGLLVCEGCAQRHLV